MSHYGQRELGLLAPYAMRSVDSAGRDHPEPEHDYRGPFQRDRDRVVHSAAFRRLNGKTQVFTGNMGDYHRTRLTHTMEVASIARTIGRTLRLNEDLVEAMALLHDIGHPPFGHAGEDVLDECLEADGGFSHNQFALTLVQELERPYPTFPGLNLSRELLNAQTGRAHKDSKERQVLLEAQVVDIADSITYDAHDVDDAVKLRLLTIDELAEIPLIRECLLRIRERFKDIEGKALRRTLVHELIDCQVSNVLATSQAILNARDFKTAQAACEAGITINVSPPMGEKKHELESFLYHRVYRHEQVIVGRRSAQQRLLAMFDALVESPDQLPKKYRDRINTVGTRRSVADYLASMTDQYCLNQHQELVSDRG